MIEVVITLKPEMEKNPDQWFATIRGKVEEFSIQHISFMATSALDAVTAFEEDETEAFKIEKIAV